MTTLVALYDAKNKGVWIGSDTQITVWDSPFPIESKWKVHKNWAIGFSGNVRFINIITPFWRDIIEKHQDIHSIVNELKTRIVAEGYKAKEEDFPYFKQFPIITNSKCIWGIGGDFSYFGCNQKNLVASGSGWRLALGAAHALERHAPKVSKETITHATLQAAIDLDIYSGGSPWVKFMPEVKKAEEKPTAKRRAASRRDAAPMEAVL